MTALEWLVAVTSVELSLDGVSSMLGDYLSSAAFDGNKLVQFKNLSTIG
jgi:hypothetical protein